MAMDSLHPQQREDGAQLNGLGVHFTIGRPKLSIGRPIPTVFLLVKRGTEQIRPCFQS